MVDRRRKGKGTKKADTADAEEPAELPIVEPMKVVDMILSGPRSWAVALVNQWIDVRTTLRMDSAFCSHSYRCQFIDIVRINLNRQLRLGDGKDSGVALANWIKSHNKRIAIKSLYFPEVRSASHKPRHIILEATGTSLRSLVVRKQISTEAILLDVATYNPNVTQLTVLDHHTVIPNLALVLQSCKQLKTLTLTGSSNLNGSVFTAIARYGHKLEKIYLKDCSATDDAFELATDSLQSVHTVVLSATTTPTMTGVARLCAKATALELHYRGDNHHQFQWKSESFIAMCKIMPAIEDCSIFTSANPGMVPQAMVDAVTQSWPRLRYFCLEAKPYFVHDDLGRRTRAQVQPVVVAEQATLQLALGCPYLHTLTVSTTDVTSPYFEGPEHETAPRLRIAHLQELSGTSMHRLLTECPALFSLRIDTFRADVTSAPQPPAAHELENLHILDATHLWVEHVASLRNLYHLKLKKNDIIDDDAVIKLAAQNPNLKALHLEEFSKLTHKSLLAVVRQCPRLEEVKFGVRGGAESNYTGVNSRDTSHPERSRRILLSRSLCVGLYMCFILVRYCFCPLLVLFAEIFLVKG